MSEELVKALYKVTDDKIEGFFREHRDLSNFGSQSVEYEGLVYKSREAAYQAAKSDSYVVRLRFTTLSPSDAKREGRLIALRKDWDTIKDEIMYDIIRKCVHTHDDLKTLLLSTGDKYLEETNWWRDQYWGVYQGKGENMLGKTLMKIRDEIKAA